MRPKQDDEVIFGAALRVFARYGYRKATLEDIAGEVGLTAAGIYAYAQSKRELYEQTVRFAMLRWQERVRTAVAEQESAGERFRTMCHSALFYLAEDRDFSALLAKDPTIFPMFPTVDPYEEINADSVAVIADILAYGARTGEFRQLDVASASNLIFEMYKSFIIRAYEQGEVDYLAQNLPQTLDLFLHGIVAPQADGSGADAESIE